MSWAKIGFPKCMARLLPQMRERTPMARIEIEIDKTHFGRIQLLLQMVTAL
jgi:hypothetical protein